MRNTIIGKAIAKLVTFFNPAGAIVQAITGIFNTVMFIRDKIDQIRAFTTSIFESVKNIAAGNVAGAADYIESSIGKAIPLMIGFLARLIGLGGISEKIKKTIQKIKGPIDKGVKKAVTWIAGKAKAFGGAVKKGAKGVVNAGKNAVNGVREWWKKRKDFKDNNGESHKLYLKGEGKNAELIVESEPTPVERLLNREDVKKLDDPEGHVKKAKVLHRDIESNIDKIHTAVAKKKEDQAETYENELDNKIFKLAMHLKWILAQIGEESRDDIPQVGTYANLDKLKNTDKKLKDYTPHHVAPKALANWLSKKIATIPQDILKKTEYRPLRQAGISLETEHNANQGANLSSILIHKYTHFNKVNIEDIDNYRVHHGKQTSEIVAARMKEAGLQLINKNSKNLLHEEDIVKYKKILAAERGIEVNELTDEDLKNNDEINMDGVASTQFYLTELDIALGEIQEINNENIEQFINELSGVFHRAHIVGPLVNTYL